MRSERAGYVAAAIATAVLACVLAAWWLRGAAGIESPDGIEIKMSIAGAKETARLRREPDGSHRFVMSGPAGEAALTPDQLAARLYDEHRVQNLLGSLLNISTPAGLIWVGLGLLGQLLFTGRMLVQWLHSERVKRSEIPTIFWWMSLAGSIMLLIYFVWRVDIVGVLGQSVGFVVYVRNLMLIRSSLSAP